MERWVVTAKKADFQKIGSEFHIDPVTARIIRNRDIVGREAIEEFLHGDISNLHAPRLMKGLIEAMDIIQRGIRQKDKMRIIGDYDIDGIISTYILRKGLSRLSACVDTYIPHRIQDGYGMHRHLVEQAKEEGVDILITCDNGISAVEEIELAKEMGMTVIITDHHNIPYEERENKRVSILPPADVIINPKQEDCQYPDKNLCGAAVAYKLVEALYERYAIPVEEKEELLELVAVATVGDVMDLTGENRIFVKEGLKGLNHPVNLGMKALIQANNLEDSPLSAYHIGFVLGPCINASGRLMTASRSLELLQAENMEDAAKLAGDLMSINESRKTLTAEGLEQAIELVESTSLKEDRVLVIYLPRCHESLTGIIAGRLREKYHKPVFVLTKGETCVKGSGRSIEAYSMYDELTKSRDLLLQFGGHPLAAGLSIEEENVPRLRKRLNEQCLLTPLDLQPKVVIDVPMPISYISRNLVRELELLEPYGKANPRPLFAQKNLKALDVKVAGQKKNVVRMLLQDQEGITMEAVYFGDGEKFAKDVGKSDRIDIVYYPQINSWQGRENLRVTIQNYNCL